MKARRRVLLIAFLAVCVMALCVIAFGFLYADVVGAQAADPECAFGCPWYRPVKLFFPVVLQCGGPWCGLYTAEPEPVR